MRKEVSMARREGRREEEGEGREEEEEGQSQEGAGGGRGQEHWHGWGSGGSSAGGKSMVQNIMFSSLQWGCPVLFYLYKQSC